MLKTIIIDDEHLARENLKALLTPFSNELTIIGEANSVASGIDLVKKTRFDLLFLDVNLNDGSGFNILEEVTERDFSVVFVTAYNEFAINAFKVDAADYLLKPIERKELKRAINKVKRRVAEKKEVRPLMEDGLQAQPFRLAINEGYSFRFIKIMDIARCQADNNYTEVFLDNSERIVSGRTLKEYEKNLQGFGFFRVHQSHLINLNKIDRIIKGDGVIVQMNSGAQISVSRRKKDAFFEKIETLGIRFI